jgi:hypothetical protein
MGRPRILNRLHSWYSIQTTALLRIRPAKPHVFSDNTENVKPALPSPNSNFISSVEDYDSFKRIGTLFAISPDDTESDENGRDNEKCSPDWALAEIQDSQLWLPNLYAEDRAISSSSSAAASTLKPVERFRPRTAPSYGQVLVLAGVSGTIRGTLMSTTVALMIGDRRYNVRQIFLERNLGMSTQFSATVTQPS